MPTAYTSQQKSAIAQFISFTNTDRNMAIRHLKGQSWNVEAAANSFFSGGTGSGGSSASKSSLNKLFDKYREDPTNSPDKVNADGSMKYLNDINADPECLEYIAVAEIIQAPTVAEMTREGFVDGWSALGCDTISKQKAHVESLKRSLPTSLEAFTKIYKFTFGFAKPEGSKQVLLDFAIAYWELLFESPLSAVKWTLPNSPWSQWWAEFLRTSVKQSISKDVWTETLKFAQMTLNDESMSFWSEEASWPSVIDEFVDWVKKEKRPAEEVVDEEMEY
ncbi:DUF298-domain-containing protein [Amniculicola lignicola CBS 123094]|uniref:Defective in cullin neddylation protein n=1 Tax=Amniculicola lignicola CBS 123094 TaxID=1392246 RepID=A0A6A5WFP2_9PLEO|nr:DUF298-domain-containing protein [Amniculicola lignicola CBS 123094]